MSSFTSNSRVVPGRGVPLLVAAVLVLLELFTRGKLFDMSKDLRRFKTYPARARSLAQPGALSIACVGNSATDRGVETAVLAEGLRHELNTSIKVDKFVADESKLNTWRYLLNRYFWARGRAPIWCVINYYESNLDDGQRIEVGRLAQFFTTPRDWAYVFRNDLTGNEQRVEFLLCSAWATYAVRDRIKERVLKLAVPGYEDHAAGINGIVLQHQRLRKSKLRSSAFATLRRVLAEAREHGTRLCFVAYPTRPDAPGAPYEIEPEAIRLIRGAGMAWIDLRMVPGLRREDYDDEIHLKPEAMPVYSTYLAASLARVVREVPARDSAARHRPRQPHQGDRITAGSTSSRLEFRPGVGSRRPARRS